jgi:hypothetical protein
MLGLAGVFLGLVLTLVASTVVDINRLAGGHLPQQRGLLGLVAAVIGTVAVLYLLPRPGVAAPLLALASAIFFFSFHLYGFIACPFLLVAALLAATTRDRAATPAG